MDYRAFRHLRTSKPLNSLFWRLYPRFHSSPFWCGVWQSFFERNRLTLPVISPSILHYLALNSVIIPGVKDPSHGQDAPLNDLLFLLQLAKVVNPRRVLEIGTYRAKTTFALHENLPNSQIVSYDIALTESPYRKTLSESSRAQLIIENFSSGNILQQKTEFDLIFIDAGHRYAEVLADSEISFKVLSPTGCIVWHDYRINEFLNPGLEVPEALKTLSVTRNIFAVPGTTCAIFQPGLTQDGRVASAR